MSKPSTITVTDQFCGAGGNSQGTRMAAKEMGLNNGVEIRLAMNHWPLAVETHNTNFPDTTHVCTDISASDPRRYPSTNILVTSPECTVHSPAGGGQAKRKMFGNQLSLSGRLASDEAEERSRATMWDVCRFAEYHNYEIVIVENVVEARSKWILFDSWLGAMVKLGYDFEIKYINSMHAIPTPQSRDRMYCVFWKRGNKRPDLNFMPIAPCHHCSKNVESIQWWKPKRKKSTLPREHGKYRQQYLYRCPSCANVVEPYYYAAFNCVDWTKRGTRIGDRKKPYSPKTIARCEYGINKYWSEAGYFNEVQPIIISSRYIEGISNRVKASVDALPVQVTDGRESVLFAPFIIDSAWSNSKPRVDHSSVDPLSTQDTGQTKSVLFPLVVENYGQSKSKIMTDALGALTGTVKQGIITTENFNSFIAHYYGGSNVTNHITEAVHTFSTRDRASIVTPPAHQKPKLEDCYYRMLLPDEIQKGMAFEPGYIVLGDAKQKVKQLGNAVTPPVMKFLMQKCIETLL